MSNSYEVKHSISTINDFCDNPDSYGAGDVQEIKNDAKYFYDNKKISKDKYDYISMKADKALGK